MLGSTQSEGGGSMSDKYRILGPDEVIQEGDEWRLAGRAWQPCESTISQLVKDNRYCCGDEFEFRRKVAKEPTVKESLSIEDWKARAEKAERERDEARDEITKCLDLVPEDMDCSDSIVEVVGWLLEDRKERDQLRDELEQLKQANLNNILSKDDEIAKHQTENAKLREALEEINKLMEQPAKQKEQDGPAEFYTNEARIAQRVRLIVKQALAKGEKE